MITFLFNIIIVVFPLIIIILLLNIIVVSDIFTGAVCFDGLEFCNHQISWTLSINKLSWMKFTMFLFLRYLLPPVIPTVVCQDLSNDKEEQNQQLTKGTDKGN